MQKQVELVQAAVQLRVSWHTAYRLMLQGHLAGERRHGRWFVSAESVKQVATERQAENTVPAA